MPAGVVDDRADDRLENRWAMTKEGKIELCSQRRPDAKQIIDASYDPEAERLYVTFRDRARAV
jgi:hypothetical protein